VSITPITSISSPTGKLADKPEGERITVGDVSNCNIKSYDKKTDRTPMEIATIGGEK
jgi:hypothetical protein